MLYKITTYIFFLSLLSACGSSGGDGSIDDPFGETPVSEAPNLIVSTQFFGENGNIYKPQSDDKGAGQGNMVVLFSASFTTQFESCSIRKSNGEIAPLLCINDQPWTQIPFSCFSNGNRQTWRANFSCNEVGEVKVTCKDMNQEVVFTVPESARSFVCTRFG